MAADAGAESASEATKKRCIIHFSVVDELELKEFSGVTWPKALASAEIWRYSEGEKARIAVEFLTFAASSPSTSSGTQTIPTEACFHRQCYQKFTCKRRLGQVERKRGNSQDAEKSEEDQDGKLKTRCHIFIIIMTMKLVESSPYCMCVIE